MKKLKVANADIKTHKKAYESANDHCLTNTTEAMFELVSKRDRFREQLAELQKTKLKKNVYIREKKKLSNFMKAFQIDIEARISRVDRRVYYHKEIAAIKNNMNVNVPTDPDKKESFIKNQQAKISKIESDLVTLKWQLPMMTPEQLKEEAAKEKERIQERRLARKAWKA